MTGVDEPNWIVNTKHKRYDRVLIDNKCAREHMKYLTRKVLKKMKEDEILTRGKEDIENANLMQVVWNKFEPRFTAFLAAFIEDFHTYDNKFVCAMGELLYVLSGDSALSTVLTFHSHDIVTNAIEELRKKGYIQQVTIESLKKYTTECEKLLLLSSTNDTIQLVTNFIEYIMEKIQLVQSVSCAVQEPEDIPNAYYPPGGTAYYFTESGAQVRKLPLHAVDVTSSRKKNYNPQVYKPCTKRYPLAALGGFCHMFLFFCLVHGHTYGFHLIGGGKGIKTHSVHCLSICPMPQKSCFMTMHASFQNMHWTESLAILLTPDFGMTCSTALLTYVVTILSLSGWQDCMESTQRYVNRSIYICNVSSTQLHTCHKSILYFCTVLFVLVKQG